MPRPAPTLDQCVRAAVDARQPRRATGPRLVDAPVCGTKLDSGKLCRSTIQREGRCASCHAEWRRVREVVSAPCSGGAEHRMSMLLDDSGGVGPVLDELLSHRGSNVRREALALVAVACNESLDHEAIAAKLEDEVPELAPADGWTAASVALCAERGRERVREALEAEHARHVLRAAKRLGRALTPREARQLREVLEADRAGDADEGEAA